MKEIFKNRVVIITGVGRSGTTILGKVIGSMTPCFYLFEPALFKFIPDFPYSDTFSRLLFEDYFLPLLHGRGNMNLDEWSYMGNYENVRDIYERKKLLNRRKDSMYYVKGIKPLWVVKSNEFQHLFDFARTHFTGVRFIHIIRNGFDVVRSSLNRGWYTDDYCNNDIVEGTFSQYRVKVPRFVAREFRSYWPEWNSVNRSAYAWVELTRQGLNYKQQNGDSVIQFRYEDFCKRPMRYAEYISSRLGLKMTELTMHHVKTVRQNNSKSFSYAIAEPVKTQFNRLNKSLGYT